jgi:hypothetical protein
MFHRSQILAARRRRALEALVMQVVELSAAAVCDLVADRLEGMSVCEARGYIRARAGREIRRQTRAAFTRQPGLNIGWELLVVLRASEKVGPVVLRQLSASRTQQREGIRRAA